MSSHSNTGLQAILDAIAERRGRVERIQAEADRLQQQIDALNTAATILRNSQESPLPVAVNRQFP